MFNNIIMLYIIFVKQKVIDIWLSVWHLHSHLNRFKVRTRYCSRISFPIKSGSQDMADKLLKMSININNINSTYIK